MSPVELKKNKNQALSTVVGATLTSVKFALDHLVLSFGENGSLTTLIWPLITASGRTLANGAGGYRDQLCELIGHAVKSALIDDEEAISIFFANGQDLFISLSTYAGKVERAILARPGNSPLFL